MPTEFVITDRRPMVWHLAEQFINVSTNNSESEELSLQWTVADCAPIETVFNDVWIVAMWIKSS